MTLIEKLESELRRLDMVQSECLEKHGADYAMAEKQKCMVIGYLAKVQVAQMSFDAYNKAKKL